MADIAQKIEALLFAAGKPMTVKSVAKLLDISADDVVAALGVLQERYISGGLRLVEHDGAWQMVTAPEVADAVKTLAKEDAGELTRPALETLTVIAYRGPITKAEIEAIRGVNCSLILRNLMIRGLIDEQELAARGTVYTLSMDAVRYLGLSSVKDLPGYEDLSGHARISQLLEVITNVENEV